jgi:alkanesulfonate monooxygenase SsuD/methylene tetrahydromethanopterin reductase-like flavin-dependent oxidoreductase (luciferase family)
MKTGIILMSQDCDEYVRPDLGIVSHPNSSRFFRDEMYTGELGASLGFDTIWNVEHHFTAHGVTPAPLQQLAYLAGKTGVSVGTCVIVLPWNDPVRVAEQIAVLDNIMAPGKTFSVGFGRGSAQPEFDGFEVKLSESSDRFTENWEIIRLLLTEENVSYEGRWRCFENLTVLPRLRTPDILDRAHYSWGSKTSMKFAAEMGFSPLFVAKGSIADQSADMQEFNRIRADRGRAPAQPVVCLNVFIDEDAAKAEELGRHYLRNFYRTTLDHYQRLDAAHFESAGNYAETAAAAAAMAKRDHGELLTELAGLQICGTPQTVLEQLDEWRRGMNPSEIALSLRFGGMPIDIAEKNIRLMASLLPEIHRWPDSIADDDAGGARVGLVSGRIAGS